MVDAVISDVRAIDMPRQKVGLRRLLRRKSSIAFLMALPLILLIGLLVLYPAFYAMYLAMLNKSMKYMVWFSNFTPNSKSPRPCSSPLSPWGVFFALLPGRSRL